MFRRIAALSAASSFVLAAAAAAQEEEAARQPVETIVVYGENVYRDRTSDIAPTLSYGLDFFQRFEPTTVGEMLKRVPGVTFTSDILEYDAVQLRGLGSEYAQVLVNGRKVPGQGADRTFFVDRIPAELIERIEIIRAPSADMDAEGVAGTLNVILKDGARLDGAFGRVAGSYFGDGDDKVRGSAAFAVAGENNGFDYWFGADVQQRRNPKEKFADIFDADGVFDEERETQDDTRDGTDYSLNGSVGFDLGAGELRLNGYYVLTDREESEFTQAFEGPLDGLELDGVETQLEDIQQKSYGVDGLFEQSFGGGMLSLQLGYAAFDEDTTETERELDPDTLEIEEEDVGTIDIKDDDLFATAAYAFNLPAASELKIGLDVRRKNRDGVQLGDPADVEADVEETRLAPFAKMTWGLGENVELEAGLRYERYDREVSNEDGSGSKDGAELYPSLHLLWDVTPTDRLRASIARTARYPGFNLVSPFEEDESPGDGDITVGNPFLDVETAWGVDLGFERRIGKSGVFGANVFYRDVTDVIELADTGEDVLDDEDEVIGAVFAPANLDDGKVWGVELDLSTPLTFIGLPETGFYANYAWFDSEVTDPFLGVERPFRDQADYVYNVSLAQNFPNIAATAGLSYQKRGASEAFAIDEIETTEYDGNLELFLEKRLGERTVVRFTANNLLDAKKTETKLQFDGDNAEELAEAIRNGDIDAIEVEIEESSPVFTITLRTAF